MGRPRSQAPDLSAHHERIRRRGVNGPIHLLARLVLVPVVWLYFRVRRTGHRYVPSQGPVILAANHRSFLDPFVIAVCIRRPAYFVAKRELFERRLTGRLLNALGAFPVRRGESDEEAMATARAVLERGGALVIFPEGTRTRSGPLARPKRGLGRLALQTGAPVVPIALLGTERARRGWLIRPCRVAIRFGRPLTYPRVENPSPHLAAEVSARVWPCVELQWEWLGGERAPREADVAAAREEAAAARGAA